MRTNPSLHASHLEEIRKECTILLCHTLATFDQWRRSASIPYVDSGGSMIYGNH